jgi:hypothetical protein
MKIPYRIESGRVLRPMVNVDVLGRDGVIIPTEALVDSGADVSLFDMSFARASGVAIHPQLIEHISGVSSSMDVFPATITVRILGHGFRMKVHFAERIDPNLLGRDRFFHVFRVCFDEQKHEIDLRYRRK